MGMQNLTGHTLGQYELRGVIGVGGMGAVYRGYQASLKRYVAVKVIAGDLAQQPGYLDRFTQEAETSAALQHPHIIKVFDYGVQTGISYIVLEMLNGGTLAERIAQGEGGDVKLPSLGETSDMLRDIGSALDYAHSRGVVHRDIKPSNVMFDDYGNAYLVDFGIAKLVASTQGLTEPGKVVGTWGYMAPEQWRNEQLTAATDQYALGVMTYALVTGKMPFDAQTPAGVMHKHLNEPPTPPTAHRTDVPDAVTLVLERSMAKKPGDRFPACTAFAQAFDQAIRGNSGPKTGFFTMPMLRKTDDALRPFMPSPPPMAGPPVGTPVTMGPPSPAMGLPSSGQYAESPVSSPGMRADRSMEISQVAAEARSLLRSPILWLALAAVVILTGGVLAALLLLGGDDDTGDKRGGVVPGIETPTPTDIPPTGIVLMPSVTPQPTNTPPPTVTPLPPPDTATPVPVETQMVLDMTATAAQWTPTPSNTPLPTPTFTASPDWTATYNAVYQAAMFTLTAEAWTDTPTPTFTPSPTFTPDPVIVAYTPVNTNADWTPVVRDFNGVEMVLVPAGCFEMGSLEGDDDETPVHTVCFEEPFWIDRYEVTNAQFTMFGGQAGQAANVTFATNPREMITWQEANDFCALRGARLPHEAEWEYAAVGPDDLRYPWGNDFNCNRGNFDDEVGVDPDVIDGGLGCDGYDLTAPAAGFPQGQSWVGAHNMSGNVWEWVADWRGPYDAGLQVNPQGPVTGDERIVKGSSWDAGNTRVMRPANRVSYPPNTVIDDLGFRCVMGVEVAAAAAPVVVNVGDAGAGVGMPTATLAVTLAGGGAVGPRLTPYKEGISVNVRTGDTTRYPVVGRLEAGAYADIVGISNTGTGWFYIELPNGTRGWVAPQVVNVTGSIANLPSIAPPSLDG